MKTGVIELNNMSLSSLFQFITNVIELIQKIGAEKLKIAPQFNGLLLPAFANFDDAYKQAQKSEFTDKIRETDKLRDNVISIMLSIINALIKDSDKNVNEAAKNLKRLFDDYKGITKKSFNEQTAETTNLLQALKGKFAGDIEKLGLSARVVELERLNNEINSYMSIRFEETAEKNKTNTAQSKKEAITAYRTICKLLDVYITTEGAANYADFVRNLNAIITKYGGKSGKSTTTPSGDNTPDTPSQSEGEFSDVQLWDANEDYTKMSLGDRRKTSDGRIWEAIDLGQVHRDPTGEFGHFGWKEVTNTESEDEVTYCEEG